MKIETIDYLKKEIHNYCRQLPYAEYILEEEFIENMPKLYYAYPLLFMPAFGMNITEKNTDFITSLSISGFLIFRSTIIKDRLVDNDDLEKLNKIGRANLIGAKEICSESAMKILSCLFTEDSEFWNYWKIRKIEFIDGIRLDKDLKYGFVDELSFSDYADKKSALGKLAIDALFVYNGCKNETIHKSVIKAHKLFSTSLQLIDDFVDLLQDYRIKQFNWCLNIILKESPDITFANEDSLKKYFYINGIADDTITYASKTSNLALDLIKPYNCRIWEHLIQTHNESLYVKSFIINNYINTRKKKNELARDNSHNEFIFDEQFLEELDTNFSSSEKRGIIAILKESENDFLEMKHIMWLPKEEGFIGQDTTFVGDVFQRAILGCFLCELANKVKTKESLSSLINQQINLLVSVRRQTKTGGWSYLHEATEIAADADDLGQIIQFFKSANRTDLIDSLCITPINILLNDSTTNVGGIKTWIIPKQNKSKNEKIQDFFNKTKWGEGPDIEVHANFLLGLQSLQLEKYKNIIKKGCQFVIDKISPSGFWESRWYYGKYYGTLVCLTLLTKSQNLTSIIKEKTKVCILSSQNIDGGWGLNENTSDPLNTSFALLCLDESSANHGSIQRGLKYLKNEQFADGFWKPVNFIRPRGIEPYSSKIITTIYALKALLKHNHIQK